jgi:Acetyl xylan esterase (AXE1).
MKNKYKGLLVVSSIGVVSIAGYYTLKKLTKKFYDKAFSVKTSQITEDNSAYFDSLNIEKLTMENKNGLLLNGHYIRKTTESKFTFILVHGHHCSGFDLREYTEAFLNHFDCDIFLPDLQGHGESQGDVVGFGYLDAADLSEWIDFLIAINPGRPIVPLGISMGGATVCQLSSRVLPNEVKCIIEDCSYDTLYNQLNYRLKKEYKMPLVIFSRMLNKMLKKKAGYILADASPLEQVAKAKLPMLFIHGLSDDYVPSSMVFKLYNACPMEKELFYVRDARHSEALSKDLKGYVEAVAVFIDRYI